jgi:DNA-binding NarL/FixJ family response regulator
MVEQKISRVAVASDQSIYLRGLASLVMSIPKTQLVGEGRSGDEALQLCEIARPDLIILDLKNALERGFPIARQIRQKWPSTLVLLLLEPMEQDLAATELESMHLDSACRDISEEDLANLINELLKPTHHHKSSSTLQRPDHPEHSPIPEALHLSNDATTVRSEEVLARELTMAGRIQADILPEVVPTLPGWEITSGDFYDFIPLTDHKLAITVADVTDKGMGAALFMALSSTLLRTYAIQFPTLPALTLSTVSRRILSDTRGSMFVTAFFGILEPLTGRFIYANAGHPPGFLINTQRGRRAIEYLRPTGMSLGVTDQAAWKQKIVKLRTGDLLVLYTDGVTEAENSQGISFGEERLLDIVLDKASRPAREISSQVLDDVHAFVGNTPRQDDIALIIIRKTS